MKIGGQITKLASALPLALMISLRITPQFGINAFMSVQLLNISVTNFQANALITATEVNLEILTLMTLMGLSEDVCLSAMGAILGSSLAIELVYKLALIIPGDNMSP